MRVLILAHDFPPLNSIGARRPYSWYQHLPENGIHPVVITKSWEASSGNIQEIVSQRGNSKVEVNATEARTLIRVPFRRLLPERLMIRYGSERRSRLRKALTLIYLMLSYPFLWFDKNAGIYREAERYLGANKVDYIIATGEPFILFKYAHRLGKKFNVPWIADFRDGWASNHVTAQQKSPAVKLLRRWEWPFEKKYLASCHLIVTVDPLLAAKLKALHHKEVAVIYNGFEEFFSAEPVSVSTSMPLRLCHAGTVYPGHRVEMLLQAVDELDQEGKVSPADLRVNFIGIEYFPEQHRRIMDYSPRVAKYLHTTQRLPQAAAKKEMMASDFLLLFTEATQPVIQAKTYDYLSVKRPVMVVLNDHSLLGNLVTELQAGVLIESSDELKKFLLECIVMKKQGHAPYHHVLNEQRARRYTRAHQAARFAAVLKQQSAQQAQ